MPRYVFYICMAFGIAIAGGSAWFYVSSWLEVAEGNGWPSTQGIVRSVDVEDHVSEGSSGSGSSSHSSYTYAPRIAYSYRVGNRDLNGERIWLTGNDFYNHREDAVAFIQDYPVGQHVQVIYDPRHPGQAALLNPNPPWQILLFTAVGLVWIALTIGFSRSGRRPTKPRFGNCRQCGTRLPFAQHASVRSEIPGDMAALIPAPGLLPCPRCGQREPLMPVRNRRGLILFAILFFGIWAVLIYLMYFVM